MTKRISVLVFVLALVGFTSVRALAQTSEASLDPETRAHVQDQLHRMSTELNLTNDQEEQLKPILQTEFQQLQSVKNDASLSPDEKQAKAQDIHQSAKSQMGSVLTPDQQKKLAAMKKKAQEN